MSCNSVPAAGLARQASQPDARLLRSVIGPGELGGESDALKLTLSTCFLGGESDALTLKLFRMVNPSRGNFEVSGLFRSCVLSPTIVYPLSPSCEDED